MSFFWFGGDWKIKKGSGCATVLEYGDEIRDAVLMAFGENVTRISLAATAKKYTVFSHIRPAGIISSWGL